MNRALVYTDLDGSLLDHQSYSFAPAMPALATLREADIPLVPASSKTRAELLPLRRELDNPHPFICENGAAVFIPADYFAAQPADTVAREGYWVREFSGSRALSQEVLEVLSGEFPGEFTSFESAGVDGIMAMTGLDHAGASLANQREYSEPVQWLGSEARQQQFIAAVAACGLTATPGGRFIAIAGDADKGLAIHWLRDTYRKAWDASVINDLAVGDSPNDRSMLEAAGHALLIRSPAHPFPDVQRDSSTTLFSEHTGPAGWNAGVLQWLQILDRDNKDEAPHG